MALPLQPRRRHQRAVGAREDLYFGYQFATKAATPTSVPAQAIRVYVDALKASPEALRSSFEFYRAIDEIIAQNTKRKKTMLRMQTVAVNVSSAIIPGSGHFLMDEKPQELTEALTLFLAPYRR